MPASHRRGQWPLAVAACLLLVACSNNNGLGPAKPANPLATAANVGAIHGTFSSDVFRSFQAATPYAPTATSPFGTLRPILNVAQATLGAGRTLSLADRQRAATALQAALAPSGGTILASIFPPGVVLGTTYTWNSTSLRYEPSNPPLTGAPANGVRFILYALDASGLPIATQQIGYADLMDESGTTTQVLHILVVGTTTNPPVTYLDYTITVAQSPVTGGVVGFITDGTERLNFNITVTETTTRATIDMRFDVTPANAHVQLQVSITSPSTSVVQFEVNDRIEAGGEVIVVTGTETVNLSTQSESGSLVVQINAGIYATITDSNGSLSYSGGGGQNLTADDQTALLAIFNAVTTSLQSFNELLAPGGSLGL